MVSSIQPGSGIAVVSPSGPAAPEAYHAGVAMLSRRYRLVHAGYLPPDPGARLPYLAMADTDRARWLNMALRDPQVQAIFCIRGGYGVLRIMDQLDAGALRRRRVPLVGFSDVTALHAWAAIQGVPTIHGPVVTQLPRLPAEHVEALFALLEGRGAPRLRGLLPLCGGAAGGTLFGGNLTVLSHLCGTPLMPDLEGRILLLEEVNEAPYRIDRALTQLRLSGVLQRAAGVVVGDCAPGGDSLVQQVVRVVLEDRLGDLDLPVVLEAPVGHGPRNLALPLGVPARLDADLGTLEFDDG